MSPSSRYYEEKRKREEERRQKELERRKEEAAERQRAEEKERLREEERREEARREALEFEAALERARIKREQTLAQLRLQKRVERREADREVKRRDMLLAALREANKDREREEARKERSKEAHVREKETSGAGRAREITQEEQQRDEARKEALRARKKEFERFDKDQVEKKETRHATREELAKERLKERKREETESEAEEKRRAELIKKRVRELSSAQRAEERKALALAARKEQQEQEAKEAERRELTRRERMQEQKQERERIEKEAERRKAQVKERRSQEKEEGPRSLRETVPREKPAAPRPLDSRLPSGLLSGRLPWLLTYDNRIVTTEGEVVFLRGVNLPPLDALGSSGYTVEELLTEVLSWGANVIRLGVSHGQVTGGESASRTAYLDLLDRVIAVAAEGNCYTVVHPLDGPAEAPADAPYLWTLSCDDVITTLCTLSERYASEPAVLLDLGYPPRNLLAGEIPSRETAWSAWNGLIPNLIAELRERHPRAFCFAGGLDRGADISGFPVTGQTGRPIPGLAYSASIRPGRADPWGQIRRLALGNPLFVSEWGAATNAAHTTAWEAAWGERVAVMMETLGVGWAAAFWDGLVKPTPHGKILLTPFGAVVKRALTRANTRAELSQLTRFSLTM